MSTGIIINIMIMIMMPFPPHMHRAIAFISFHFPASFTFPAVPASDCRVHGRSIASGQQLVHRLACDCCCKYFSEQKGAVPLFLSQGIMFSYAHPTLVPALV